jgi:hypothetical protein
VAKARSQPTETAVFLMESFMEIIMETSKASPFQMSKTKRNPLYFKRIALFEKSGKIFFEVPKGIHKPN